MKVEIMVTDKHVHKGHCGDSQKCAVALAVLEQGFGNKGFNVEVGTTSITISRWDGWRVTRPTVDFNLNIPLSKKVRTFITNFDKIEMEDDDVAARKALAAKLKKTPFKFTLDIPDEFADTVYTKPGKKAAKRKK